MDPRSLKNSTNKEKFRDISLRDLLSKFKVNQKFKVSIIYYMSNNIEHSHTGELSIDEALKCTSKSSKVIGIIPESDNLITINVEL